MVSCPVLPCPSSHWIFQEHRMQHIPCLVVSTNEHFLALCMDVMCPLERSKEGRIDRSLGRLEAGLLLLSQLECSQELLCCIQLCLGLLSGG